jgi:hypothetical protein
LICARLERASNQRKAAAGFAKPSRRDNTLLFSKILFFEQISGQKSPIIAAATSWFS